MIKGCAGLAVCLALATTAFASYAPSTSPIPKLRYNPVAFSGAAIKRSPIPRLRNSKSMAVVKEKNLEITTLLQIAELERQEEVFKQTPKQTTQTAGLKIGVHPIKRSAIPRLRPNSFARNTKKQQVVASTNTPSKPLKAAKTKRQRKKGSVCGVRSIRGKAVSRINGKGRCGIANPVKITEVAGVSLTREVTVNCTTAKRLDDWVSKSAKPLIGRKGGGLVAVQVIGGYSCRTRNSKRGAKLSEHAIGNAVDIAGFKLKNGTIYSVKKNWRSGKAGKTLRKLHKSACGPFGTVLGPNSDRHHHDHFHFDVARHRGGAYCR
jgi:hypothetical protein